MKSPSLLTYHPMPFAEAIQGFSCEPEAVLAEKRNPVPVLLAVSVRLNMLPDPVAAPQLKVDVRAAMERERFPAGFVIASQVTGGTSADVRAVHTGAAEFTLSPV